MTPYVGFYAYKIITSHARWDNDGGDYDNIKFDYQTLIFWVAPDPGLVMFQDEQKTLTDEEVEKSVSLVLKLLKERFNATQRI